MFFGSIPFVDLNPFASVLINMIIMDVCLHYTKNVAFIYVWYCNIGAERFGWCDEFILKADKLLLYHSSSADIPEWQ